MSKWVKFNSLVLYSHVRSDVFKFTVQEVKDTHQDPINEYKRHGGKGLDISLD